MAGGSSSGSAPSWAIGLAVVFVVVVVGFFAWRSFGKNPAAGEGPPMPVRPGMIDFKKEAASGNLGGGLKGLANGKQ